MPSVLHIHITIIVALFVNDARAIAQLVRDQTHRMRAVACYETAAVA